MPGKKNNSAKGGKIGRNKTKCDQYRARGIREKNKARRIAKDARRSG